MQNRIKRTVTSFIAGAILLLNSQVAFASDYTTVITKDVNEQSVQNMITAGIDDLGVQLDDLYREVGKNLNIDYMYVKIIHLLAGGKAVYADKRPNIYSDVTVDTLSGPFEIEGAKQSNSKMAPWAYCPDETVIRPSKYYLPDAAYNTTADIIKIMNKRLDMDRGTMQPYFNALKKDIKTNILFNEAVLIYTGASENTVNSFYKVYEKILYDKDPYENILVSTGNGLFDFKDNFKQIFIDNGIDNERDLVNLAIVLSFDRNLAALDDPSKVTEEFVVPYKIGYTSRENMMVAAMSIVGKVRYVWGGGHLSTGNIQGINPAWKAFNEEYATEKSDNTENNGFNQCIRPDYSWCPYHGIMENANGCLLESDTVYSVEEYLDSRKEIIGDMGDIDKEKYDTLLKDVIYLDHGITSHRLDGLDCSGYTSWVYNQIDRTHMYDGGAQSFISTGQLKSIAYGSRLLPGDVFTWGSHIVLVIGQYNKDSDAYVMVEASPNTVKFGVIYYSSALSDDIKSSIEIAKEANQLLGGLASSERTNAYNMDNVGYYTEVEVILDDGTTELMEVEVTDRYIEIGRLNNIFIDEYTNLSDYDKKITDMDAKEIIQHTLEKLPESYISGQTTYEGKIFKLEEPDDSIESTKILDYIDDIDIEGLDEGLTVEIEKEVDKDGGLDNEIQKEKSES